MKGDVREGKQPDDHDGRRKSKRPYMKPRLLVEDYFPSVIGSGNENPAGLGPPAPMFQ